MSTIRGLLFDKDGTLFNFRATWGDWSARLVRGLAAGDEGLASGLANAIGFDLQTTEFADDSPVIAATPAEIAAEMVNLLPDETVDSLVARMNSLATTVRLSEAVALRPLFAQLRARGLRIGLATNDGEVPARAHLKIAGIDQHFDFVAGSDSGHGGKPAAGMQLAFAATCGLQPGEVAMIGDSLHDLQAGRAAGMVTIGVLTGPASAETLAPLADCILRDIGQLPAWLDGRPISG